MRVFDIRTKIDATGRPIEIGFPYPEKDAYKVRRLDVPKKESFRTTGPMGTPQLFGKDKFPPGSGKAITITEGEFDAASYYQVMGRQSPTVSVRSASSARNDCEENYQYLNSFEKIYLAFDNDEAGRRAKEAVAGLFDFNKVYDVHLALKDANDYLQQGRGDELRTLWFNAKRFLPEGVISTYAEVREILEGKGAEAIASFPFPTIQAMTYGIRPGEVVLLTAQEGIGKTEYLRAIEAHLLRTTEENIAIIHLEEQKDRSIKGIAGYELGIPCHIPDFGVSPDDIFAAYSRLTRRDERLHIYPHFDSDDPNTILDTIRFLVTACKCKFVLLDHITFLVTGAENEDERKVLDYLSTRMAKMADDLKFSLILVSHENDDGKTRGSRNVSKVADCRIRLERNLECDNPEERNTTRVTILKNRFGSHTGPAGFLYFDPGSFIIRELTEADRARPPEIQE